MEQYVRGIGSRRVARAIALAGVVGLSVGGEAGAGTSVELLRVTLDAPVDHPCLAVRPDARQASGVLHTTSMANWRRGGLEVGPTPMPKGHLVVTYDFRPVRLGAQGQSFVSQVPKTHWYMLFADPTGRLNLHTRHKGKWQQRKRSTVRVRVGVWYRAHVRLTRTSIRLTIAQRRGEKVPGTFCPQGPKGASHKRFLAPFPPWDTGEVAMDDVGDTTVFMLTDEAPTAKEAETVWDNLVVTTDDAAMAKRFTATTKRLAEEKRRREQERAEAKAAAEALRRRGIALLPMPQKIRLGKGDYDLAGAPIVFPAELESDARSVRLVLGERATIAPELQPGGTTGIRLRRVDRGPWPAAKTRPSEGYRLSVKPGGTTIEAQSGSGFLCAAQTLAQLARDGSRVPVVEIVDWPAIENRLVMIALSQGAWQKIDVAYWQRMIRELAAVKTNMIMPYFDGGTYYYEKYPFLGIKGRDGFTREKGRLLSDYAYARGIELVPQQQTLGHSSCVLRHKELAHLRESGGVFCSSKPEVFAFFGDLFDELVQAFPHARYQHAGGDEFGHGFAKCPLCKARAEKIGKPGLYAEHMMRVRRMLADRERKMMIWWHEQGYTEAAADKLAKDIVIFDWHYGNQSRYPSLERLQKLGFEHVWATPAVTRYYSATNDYGGTFGNIRGFLTAGVERGVPGACTCTWVHGIWGGRNLFELNYYGLVYSAQCAWKPANAHEDDFGRRFARHWFGLAPVPELADEVTYAWHAPFGPTDEQGFWRNSREPEKRLAATPAATIADLAKTPALVQDAERLLALCTRARGVLDRWRTAAKRNRQTIDFLAHDVHVHETLARRIVALDRLRREYPKVRAARPARRPAMLKPIVKALEALVSDYEKIERMFDRSIKEAGGGRCGWGPWFPFVTQGGIQFRAEQGRRAVQELAERLSARHDQADWPKKGW